MPLLDEYSFECIPLKQLSNPKACGPRGFYDYPRGPSYHPFGPYDVLACQSWYLCVKWYKHAFEGEEKFAHPQGPRCLAGLVQFTPEHLPLP